jgi:SAM-dependent methyltransferase
MTENWQNWNDEKIIDTLDKDWNENLQQRRTLHEVLLEIKVMANLAVILDAGCGTCVSYEALLAMGYCYEGIDVTPMMIQRAKEKFPGIYAEVKDILDLTEEDRVQVVLSADVLIHVDDPKKYLCKLWEVADYVLVLKLAYVWTKPSVPHFDGTFYNWKFNSNDLFNMFLSLDPCPKKIGIYCVDDDEKTTPEFLNAQVFTLWK